MAMDYSNPANTPYLPGPFAFDDPAADFRRFASQQPQFFQRQRGLNDWNQRMQARYLLDAPDMAGAGQTGNESYYDYLKYQTEPGNQSYDAFRPSSGSYNALLEQAQEAARASTTTSGDYLTPYANAPSFNRRSWLFDQFGGQNAAANQMAVANLLALQRNRGAGEQTAYSGQMGQAIRNAMGAMYQDRLNEGAPKETFLDWYLSASGQGA